MKFFLKRKIVRFDFFFNFLTNTVFVKRDHVWGAFSLPKFLLVQYCMATCGKFRNAWVFKFMSNRDAFWAFFWKLFTFNRVNSVGFFAELELIGLGFRIKKITSVVYRFFWGHANYTYLFVPHNLLFEYAAEERLIFLFSTAASVVNGVASYFMLLKKLSAYRITGFVRPGRIIRLNSGKQR